MLFTGPKPSSQVFMQSEEIRYLGIQICRTMEEMVKQNVTPVINQIQEKCQRWTPYPLSWMGEIAAIKMVLLPKVLFVFLNIILDIYNTEQTTKYIK